MPVYCKDCIFYISGDKIPVAYGPPAHILEQCLAPENSRDSHKDEDSRQQSVPKIINRFNNCTWFQAEGDASGDDSSGDSGESGASGSDSSDSSNQGGGSSVLHSGMVSLTDGMEEVVVSGLDLQTDPTVVVLTVTSDAELAIFYSVNYYNLTRDGFTALFSSEIVGGDYILSYAIF